MKLPAMPIRSSFARSVLTLVTGTTIAQAIPILIAPLLARLYTPADFGVFAVFASVVGVLSVATTGSYQLAVILPESDRDAANIAAVGIVIAAAFSGLVGVCLLLSGPWIAELVGQQAIVTSLYWVPLSLVAIGIYQVLYYWSNRQQRYRQMAGCRIAQAIVLTLTTVVVGVAVAGPTGLLAGFISGQLTATILLGLLVWKADGRLLRTAVSSRELRKQARRYADFPRYSVPSDTINLVAGHAPVFFLTAFFGPAVVGLYALTQRVLSAPISVIAAAIADVYKQRASQEFREQGDCRAIFVRTLKVSLLLATPFFVFFLFAAPSVFAVVFGSEWRAAGVYAQIMTVLYLLRFIVSPLSRTLYVAEKQRYDLIWQVGLLAVIVSSLWVGSLLGSELQVIGLFTAGYSLMYLIALAMSYYFAGGQTSPIGSLWQTGWTRKAQLPPAP